MTIGNIRADLDDNNGEVMISGAHESFRRRPIGSHKKAKCKGSGGESNITRAMSLKKNWWETQRKH